MNIMGVIPARLNSSRLPGKVLRPLLGKPLLWWTWKGASEFSRFKELIVATDSEAVKNACREHNIPCVMTPAGCRNGTERSWVVMNWMWLNADVVVNVQADEVMIRGPHLDAIFDSASPETWREFLVSTVTIHPSDPNWRDNPNHVKVVTDGLCQCSTGMVRIWVLRGNGRNQRALYFSRAPIPGAKHVGVYAYTREALERYVKLPQGALEVQEKLEQLRFLENGIAIRVLPIQADLISVDTEDDLRRAEEALRARTV